MYHLRLPLSVPFPSRIIPDWAFAGHRCQTGLFAARPSACYVIYKCFEKVDPCNESTASFSRKTHADNLPLYASRMNITKLEVTQTSTHRTLSSYLNNIFHIFFFFYLNDTNIHFVMCYRKFQTTLCNDQKTRTRLEHENLS